MLAFSKDKTSNKPIGEFSGWDTLTFSIFVKISIKNPNLPQTSLRVHHSFQ